MLSEYRKNYEQLASQIPNWIKISKSELCFKYLKYKKENNPLCEVYLAAVIAKFLKRAESEYYNQSYQVISEEEYYDLIIESVMRMLSKKSWENKDSKLYGNVDAPEIAINTNIKSNKINLYVFLQRDKRKLNNNILSLDTLEENSSDGYFLPYNDEDISIDLYINQLVVDYFNHKEYANAFIIDSIMNKNIFIHKNNNIEFSPGKLKTCLKNIDDQYCKIFSNQYNLNLNEVKHSIKYVKELSNSKLNTTIQRLFKNLKNNKELYSLTHNAY